MKKYNESQNFMSNWLIILLIILFGVEFYDVYENYQIKHSVEFGVSFWIFLAVLLSLILVRLKVAIDDDGIAVKFFPFVLQKKWNWDSLESAHIVQYSLMDYGGWGYRISKKGIAYTTKGKYGIQLVLKDGKQILIGTQQPKEVELILSKYFVNTNEQ